MENPESFSVGVGVLGAGVNPFDDGSLISVMPERNTTVIILDNDCKILH